MPEGVCAVVLAGLFLVAPARPNAHDVEANNRIGLTAALPVASRQAIRLVVTSGLTATAGSDYTSLAVAWQGVV